MSELKEKCKVVMLQTTSLITNLYKSKFENKLYYNAGVGTLNQRFYLYICSNREIKVGDYVYNTLTKGIVYVDCKANEDLANSDRTRLKVEASTDKSLGLPEPSSDFIKKYVEKYNEDSPIEEVMVEMSYKDIGGEEGEFFITIPIVRKDNTIIISKAEESWGDIWLKRKDFEFFGQFWDYVTKNYSVPQKLK